MKPNARTLAMRDPALAAIMGVLGASAGADFGAEFGNDYGAEFGDDFGEFGLDAPAVPVASSKPNAQAMMALWQQHQMKRAHTTRREMLLEPNKGSTAKIERYSFSINQDIVLGTAQALELSGQPDTTIRPQRVTMNAPQPGFATIAEIKVANVSVTVGGDEDAYDYNALAVGSTLDMPTLSPANRAKILGNYTGFVPPGFVGGSDYKFTASFKGPASIVA